MNTRWLIKNWFRVGHKISWKLSFETLASLMYFVPAFKKESIYKIVQKKHEFVLSYLKEAYSYRIDQYRDIENVINVPTNHYVWVMWWQGEDSAPELVRMCINSIRKNANGAEVVVITKDNFREYADIPEYIIEKHKRGIICRKGEMRSITNTRRGFRHLRELSKMIVILRSSVCLIMSSFSWLLPRRPAQRPS